MSKPDPAITANLLNSVLGKADGPHEEAPKRQSKPGHPEAHPVPKAAKPKTAKHSAGPGRMRSCNRGK